MSTTTNNNPGSAAFTPGPWKVLPDSHRVGGHPNHLFRFVATANWTEDDGDFSVTGEIVAKLTDSPCIAANARLIAASPSMHAVLSRLVAMCDAGYDMRDGDGAMHEVSIPLINDARALLAQIGGGQ